VGISWPHSRVTSRAIDPNLPVIFDASPRNETSHLMCPRPHSQLILRFYGLADRSGVIKDMNCEFKPNTIGQTAVSKVPEVTLAFWIIKIAANHFGRNRRRYRHHDAELGYLVGTALFLVALIGLVGLQIAAKKFHPFLYWATIVASTTFGTTMADFADRSLGIGYTGGSSLLLISLLAVLGLWYRSLGTISVDTVNTPKAEAFYWRPSRSPRPWHRGSATGWPIRPGSATKAVRSCSRSPSRWSSLFITGPASRGCRCSGRHSS